MSEPWILGLGASHNGSACLLRGTELVVAIQEERLSGVKRRAVTLERDCLSARYCLDTAGIKPSDLAAIAVSALPSHTSPQHDLRRNPYLGEAAATVPVLAVGHHLAHAASAFALSGFSDAAVLVIDGAGSPAGDPEPEELRTVIGSVGSEAISIYRAEGSTLTPAAKYMVADGWVGPPVEGMRRFGTLGGMYSAVAEQIFGDLLAAGKVMGLAPYGRPTIPVEEFLTVDGERLAFSAHVTERFRHHDRWPQHAEPYQDLAASVQVALETALGAVLEDVRRRVPGQPRLCYAGGVALNAVANDRVVERGSFSEVFIVPAAEDSGLAVGAAYVALWRSAGGAARTRRLRRDSLGRPYGDEEIERAVAATPGVSARRCSDVAAETCERLASGQVVGWFQDGSELGPRALGHRSLLCDPRDAAAKDRLNARVKYREPFRPFAPVLPEAAVAEWFDAPPGLRSTFMLHAVPFRADRATEVPAVVHADRTGRLQTVGPETNPLLHRLLETWGELTSVPVLINTSFNLAGEPIVETPEDAIRCLLASRIDCCVLGSWIVSRSGTESLLDLRPVRTGEPLGEAAEVAGERGSRSSNGHIPYGVTTRWGDTVAPLSATEDAVVRAADGELLGRELVARALPETSERPAVQLLHRLGRLGVLRFTAPDGAPPAG